MTKQERQQRNAKVINLMKQGLSTRKIGLMLGISKTHVHTICKKFKNVFSETELALAFDFEPTTEKQPNALDEFVENHFKDSDRLKYIDVALRLANIQLNQELLVKVVKVVDLVNEKGGKVSVEDIVKL